MRIKRKVGASVAVLGSLLLAAGGAAPALASNGASAGLAQATGVRLAVANGMSTGFGGWAFQPKTATAVTAEFKVPTLTCTATGSGIGPISALSTGSTFDVAGVLTACESGQEDATPVVVVHNNTTDGTNALFAGDLIKTTVTNSATKTTVTVQDLTKGHTFTLTKSGAGGTAVEEFVGDDRVENTAHQVLPVANFGTITFSNGAVSGNPLGSVTPNLAINMETANKVLQILAGPLTGTKKNTFVTTFKHA